MWIGIIAAIIVPGATNLITLGRMVEQVGDNSVAVEKLQAEKVSDREFQKSMEDMSQRLNDTMGRIEKVIERQFSIIQQLNARDARDAR